MADALLPESFGIHPPADFQEQSNDIYYNYRCSVYNNSVSVHERTQLLTELVHSNQLEQYLPSIIVDCRMLQLDFTLEEYRIIANHLKLDHQQTIQLFSGIPSRHLLFSMLQVDKVLWLRIDPSSAIPHLLETDLSLVLDHYTPQWSKHLPAIVAAVEREPVTQKTRNMVQQLDISVHLLPLYIKYDLVDHAIQIMHKYQKMYQSPGRTLQIKATASLPFQQDYLQMLLRHRKHDQVGHMLSRNGITDWKAIVHSRTRHEILKASRRYQLPYRQLLKIAKCL
ncbi:hypothetical protein EDD86DRAFT_203599 [Gorgonomyces haynaldii]|nr:hypothetical protein EDD86DRAFT_203599 [Gorgonomyces haynaldii]